MINKPKLSYKKGIKILATLGSSSFKKSIVQKMDSSGVDIFRINLSHTKIEDFVSIIKNLGDWTEKPICIDTEGAQIRTGRMKDSEQIVKNNIFVSLLPARIIGDEFHIPLYPINPKEILQLGDILFIDFHSVVVQVVRFEKEKVYGRVISGGKIGSNKGVSLDRSIALPTFTQKDLKAFELSKEMGLSCFSPSFVAKEKDICHLRSFFPYPIFVISKIESRLGIRNLEEICKVSDAILIDRGDLSREVPLTKIALVQKFILKSAKRINTPVYIATNLLESMVDNFKPTRAEINDITSILLDGAKGLVLAAETAIGKHPVQSVRMTSGIRKEVEDYNLLDKNYFNSMYDYDLIEPHGGVLVQNFISSDKIKNLKDIPKIDVDGKILSDIVQIAEGTYSPLRGFMNYDELMSVLEHYKLPSGVVWTLPIIFQLAKKDIHFSKNDIVALRGEKDKKIYAIISVCDIQKIDISAISRKWFGTDDLEHPGVAYFAKRGDYIVSGKVFLIAKPSSDSYSHSLTPRQTRQIFKEQGWQKIVGFHTRNVIHRGHEFIQKKALDKVGADALFINPVLGSKKSTDFSAEIILRAYNIMLKNNYYGSYPVILGAFNTYSRYSGPREAIFTALCRKNFGCSHFIVGRDHTGVGNYYPADASYKIFDKVGDIEIVPLMFNAVYFCKICNKVTDKCSHKEEQKLKLSGSEVRRNLLGNGKIPEYLMRKDISKELQEIYKYSRDLVFEGTAQNNNQKIGTVPKPQ